MYEVTTAIKTLLITNDREEALRRAYDEFVRHNYVEVKEIVTTSPWYAVSVMILKR